MRSETKCECCKNETENKVGIKYYSLVGAVVLVLLISVFQSFQISSLKSGLTGNAVKSDGVDMGGWTEDEKMMYEHHGVPPTRLQNNAPSQMVGGC